MCHMCNDSFKQSAHLKRHMQCHIRSPSEFSLYKSQVSFEVDGYPNKRVKLCAFKSFCSTLTAVNGVCVPVPRSPTGFFDAVSPVRGHSLSWRLVSNSNHLEPVIYRQYLPQKPSPGPFKRDTLNSKPDYDSLLPRISNKSLSPLSTRPLHEYPYLLSGSLTDNPPSPDLKDKFRSYGMMLGEPAVLGELQNKYTMELIKLIGQTAEEQRKNISR